MSKLNIKLSAADTSTPIEKRHDEDCYCMRCAPRDGLELAHRMLAYASRMISNLDPDDANRVFREAIAEINWSVKKESK